MSEHVVFLTGKKVNLRPYNKVTDLELCQRWINDPEVRQYLKSLWPLTFEQEEEFLKQISSNKTSVFLIIETKDHKPIGSMVLVKINWIDRTAVTGALIGEKRYRNRGYGTDAKMILLNYAFNTLNLRKINSNATTDNKPSISYNMKCGYKIEGIRKKQFFRVGKYVDEVYLSVFKKDFQKLWKKYQQSP